MTGRILASGVLAAGLLTGACGASELTTDEASEFPTDEDVIVAIRFEEGEALEFLGDSVTVEETWDTQRFELSDMDTAVVVSRPEPSSGSSISFSVRSHSRLGDDVTPEEWFRSFIQVASDGATAKPSAVTDHAGLHGVSIDIVGLKGNRTGQPLEAKVIALFGTHNTYLITLQYELDDETLMRQELDRILGEIIVPPDETEPLAKSEDAT